MSGQPDEQGLYVNVEPMIKTGGYLTQQGAGHSITKAASTQKHFGIRKYQHQPYELKPSTATHKGHPVSEGRRYESMERRNGTGGIPAEREGTFLPFEEASVLTCSNPFGMREGVSIPMLMALVMVSKTEFQKTPDLTVRDPLGIYRP